LTVPAVAVLLAVWFRRAWQSPDWTVSP
jgi:hypothetical protein